MPKMTVRVILKSGVEFSIKCDKFTLTRNGFQQVTGYNIIRNARIAAHILTAAKSANAAKRKSKRRIRRNTLAGLRNRTLKAAGNARLIIRTKLLDVAKIALLQKKPIEREGKRQ